MTSYNTRIRPNNDPDAVWDYKLVNESLNELDDVIANQLDTALLNTNTDQTITGQKTFFNLYMSGGGPTYDKVMDVINKDISPVFGTGATAFNGTSAQELGFSKDNVSGVWTRIAQRNPLYRKSFIRVESVDASNIEVEAYNIPMAAYDPVKLGEKPDLAGGPIGVSYWATSQGLGIKRLAMADAVGGIVANSIYFVLMGYADDTNTIKTFIVKSGSEQSVSTDYKSFATLGFFTTDGSSNIESFYIENGIYYVTAATSAITLTALTNTLKQSCIVKVMIQATASPTVLGPDSNNLYTLGGAANVYGVQRGYLLNVPMVWDGTSFNTFQLTNGPVEVREIHFGAIV